MPFVAGKEKTGGRKKGTPNLVKSELKDSINKIVQDNMMTVQNDLNGLEPKERVGFLLRFIEFVIPKEKSEKIDFSSLSEEEVDELIQRIVNEQER